MLTSILFDGAQVIKPSSSFCVTALSYIWASSYALALGVSPVLVTAQIAAAYIMIPALPSPSFSQGDPWWVLTLPFPVSELSAALEEGQAGGVVALHVPGLGVCLIA